MNVEKMRKNLARQTPDSVGRTFNAEVLGEVFDQWRNHWVRMMEIKYPKRPIEMHISQSDVLGRPGYIRIHLEAVPQ